MGALLCPSWSGSALFDNATVYKRISPLSWGCVGYRVETWSNWLRCIPAVTRVGRGSSATSVWKCQAVSMDHVINPGNAPASLDGQGASATKVTENICMYQTIIIIFVQWVVEQYVFIASLLCFRYPCLYKWGTLSERCHLLRQRFRGILLPLPRGISREELRAQDRTLS